MTQLPSTDGVTRITVNDPNHEILMWRRWYGSCCPEVISKISGTPTIEFRLAVEFQILLKVCFIPLRLETGHFMECLMGTCYTSCLNNRIIQQPHLDETVATFNFLNWYHVILSAESQDLVKMWSKTPVEIDNYKYHWNWYQLKLILWVSFLSNIHSLHLL